MSDAEKIKKLEARIAYLERTLDEILAWSAAWSEQVRIRVDAAIWRDMTETNCAAGRSTGKETR